MRGFTMEDASAVPEDDVFIIRFPKAWICVTVSFGPCRRSEQGLRENSMLVSWPKWLDDGIVCMYARDFRGFMNEAVRQTAAPSAL